MVKTLQVGINGRWIGADWAGLSATITNNSVFTPNNNGGVVYDILYQDTMGSPVSTGLTATLFYYNGSVWVNSGVQAYGPTMPNNPEILMDQGKGSVLWKGAAFFIINNPTGNPIKLKLEFNGVSIEFSTSTYIVQSTPTPIPTPQPGSYQLIISPPGSGTVTTRIDANNTIFTAIPKPGFRFDHWLDVWPNGREESTLNPWTDAVTPDDVITAFFTPTSTPVPTPTPTPGPTPHPQEVVVISLDINSNPVGAKIIVNGVAVN